MAEILVLVEPRRRAAVRKPDPRTADPWARPSSASRPRSTWARGADGATEDAGQVRRRRRSTSWTAPEVDDNLVVPARRRAGAESPVRPRPARDPGRVLDRRQGRSPRASRYAWSRGLDHGPPSTSRPALTGPVTEQSVFAATYLVKAHVTKGTPDHHGQAQRRDPGGGPGHPPSSRPVTVDFTGPPRPVPRIISRSPAREVLRAPELTEADNRRLGAGRGRQRRRRTSTSSSRSRTRLGRGRGRVRVPRSTPAGTRTAHQGRPDRYPGSRRSSTSRVGISGAIPSNRAGACRPRRRSSRSTRRNDAPNLRPRRLSASSATCFKVMPQLEAEINKRK